MLGGVLQGSDSVRVRTRNRVRESNSMTRLGSRQKETGLVREVQDSDSFRLKRVLRLSRLVKGSELVLVNLR